MTTKNILFQALVSIMIPIGVLPSSIMPLNKYAGVSDELRNGAEMVDKVRMDHMKIAHAASKSKNVEKTAEFKNLPNNIKTVEHHVTMSLSKVQAIHRNYLETMQKLSDQAKQAADTFNKNSKIEFEKFADAKAQKDQVLADQLERKGNVMDARAFEQSKAYGKKMKSEKSTRRPVKVGGNPATWAPRITVDPTTHITYIQVHDKNGKLGPKQVYRDAKDTTITSDTIFEDFEKDIRDIEQEF
ncbi:MAG TPA: hypothetical protein VLG50_03445 [Candidatus Saccharimonadales bacterium]|nr:hypothetical protein [Candidatus Saccharimonadales bacterium]